MRQKIIMVGALAVITISSADLKALGLSVGDQVDVLARHGTLEVRPVSTRAHLSHDELMALVDERFGRRQDNA